MNLDNKSLVFLSCIFLILLGCTNERSTAPTDKQTSQSVSWYTTKSRPPTAGPGPPLTSDQRSNEYLFVQCPIDDFERVDAFILVRASDYRLLFTDGSSKFPEFLGGLGVPGGDLFAHDTAAGFNLPIDNGFVTTAVAFVVPADQVREGIKFQYKKNPAIVLSESNRVRISESER